MLKTFQLPPFNMLELELMEAGQRGTKLFSLEKPRENERTSSRSKVEVCIDNLPEICSIKSTNEKIFRAYKVLKDYMESERETSEEELDKVVAEARRELTGRLYTRNLPLIKLIYLRQEVLNVPEFEDLTTDIFYKTLERFDPVRSKFSSFLHPSLQHAPSEESTTSLLHTSPA